MSGIVPWLVVALPAATAAGLGFARGKAVAWGTCAAMALTLALTLALAFQMGAPSGAGALLRVDPLAAHLAVLAAASGLLAAWCDRATMTGRRAAQALAVLAGIALAALANNLLLGWIGLEVAVLGLMVARDLRGAALWRSLATILVALALTLMGGLLLYRAGMPSLGSGAMRWDLLATAAATLPAALLSLGYLLMLVGLAACAGLAPLHAWQGAAGRGNAMAAALVPALGAVALGMVLRGRDIVSAHPDALAPGPALLMLGLASLGWAALGLWRGAAIGPAASLMHAGLATLAFGLGTGTADAAGLLLLSCAVLMAPAGSSGGRARTLVLVALAMLPPFATFGAGLAVIGETVDGAPWLAIPLAAMMAAAASGLVRAALTAWQAPGVRRVDEIPSLVLLTLALLAGLLPQAARWFVGLTAGLR